MIYIFFFGPGGGPGPILQVAPGSLAFSTPIGVAPPDQLLTLSNPGTGTYSWTASADAPWLSIAPTAGAGGAGSITVSIIVSGLLSGIYNGTITITAPGASGSPAAIAVQLVVTAPVPTLGVDPLALAFTAVFGGANPAPQSVQVVNLGGGAMTWTAVPVGGNVTPVPSSGAAPASFNVEVDIAGLSVGVHNRQVVVSGAA